MDNKKKILPEKRPEALKKEKRFIENVIDDYEI